jgi:hypothetical protein
MGGPLGGRLTAAGMDWIGAAGFEPATSCSQSTRATRLRHAPTALQMMAGVGMVTTSTDVQKNAKAIDLDADMNIARFRSSR